MSRDVTRGITQRGVIKKKVFLCNEKGALGVWEIGIKDVK